jgi:fatty-acyl-CoA synthase
MGWKMSSVSQYSTDLDKNAANYTPLSPLTFIERAAAVYPARAAIIYREFEQSWAETYRRCRRFASALRRHGIGPDDTVALMLPNVPAMCEAHFAVPMAGAVPPRCRCDRLSATARPGENPVYRL